MKTKSKKLLQEKIQDLPFHYQAVPKYEIPYLIEESSKGCRGYDFPFDVIINWSSREITVTYPEGENPDKMKPYEQPLRDYIFRVCQEKIDRRHPVAKE